MKNQSCKNCYFGDNYVDGNGDYLYVICRWGPPTVMCRVIMMGDLQQSPSVWKQWNLFPKMKFDDFCHRYKETDCQDVYEVDE